MAVNGTGRSSVLAHCIDKYGVLPSNSGELIELRSGGSAGFPVSKSERTDGLKQLSNGMYRKHYILSEDEMREGKEQEWTELEIHGKIRNVSPTLWTMKHLTALFLNGNCLTRLPQEISNLESLIILDVSFNKLRTLPSELGELAFLSHLYLNMNQIRIVPYELGKLYRLQTLGLNGNPLSPEINKIYHETNGTSKLLRYLLDHLNVNACPPPSRQWCLLKQVDQEKPIGTFTVLCYNVLCDKYATGNLHTNCPSWALQWDYRKLLIVKELKLYDADIITLQEIETEQFFNFFTPELEHLGYSGIFSPKSRAKTMTEEERKFVDGCAIFWKYDKFELEQEHLIEFTQIALKRGQASEHMINRFMPRDNIALCAILKIKENVYSKRTTMAPAENVVGNPIVVCTAHIHWDPEFCDVKLIQCMILVQEMTTLLQSISENHRLLPEQIPVLICGDLNSLPDSGAVEFLLKGNISKDHQDLKGFRDDASITNFSSVANAALYTHNLQLENAVSTTSVPFTNYTMDFKGMIDYIFSTPRSLSQLGVLGPIDISWIQNNKILGFPHLHVPSDHIPIMAQYAIVPVGHQRPQYQNLFYFGSQSNATHGR